MRIELLPEKAYTSTHADDIVRVTLHFPDDPLGPRTFHDTFTLPAGGWGDEEVIAAVQAKYATQDVTFRLPEQPADADEA